MASANPFVCSDLVVVVAHDPFGGIDTQRVFSFDAQLAEVFLDGG